MHIVFEETNEKVHESIKTGVEDDDLIENLEQRFNAYLVNERRNITQYEENESTELRIELLQMLTVLDCLKNGEFLNICHWIM